MRTGVGLAIGKGGADAAIDASVQALEASGASHATLAVIFATPHYYPEAHACLHAVRRVTGAQTVLGVSGGGVLTLAREVEQEPAVAVLALSSDDLSITPFLLPQGELQDDVGRAVVEAVGCEAGSQRLLLTLPDVAGLNPPALFRGVEEALGSFCPMVGGVAAGDVSFELLNTEVGAGAMAGALLAGRFGLAIGVAQGCEPIGEPFVITQAEEHVIHEIAGRPAAEVLKDAVRAFGDLKRVQAGLFAGLAMNPAKSPLGRGDFLVRNLIGVDPDTGAVAVAERVRVGQTIQFQIRDGASAHDDLEEMLKRVSQELGTRRPAAGFYFNCLGRGQHLYGVPDHDVTLIRERLGDFPLIGFFGNGEIAPLGRQNFLHNYTGALVLLTEPEDT